MKDGVITFDEGAKENVLLLFGIIVGDDGYLMENKQPYHRLNPLLVNGMPIHITEFAGVTSTKDGKLIFLKNDIGSLIELSDKLKEK